MDFDDAALRASGLAALRNQSPTETAELIHDNASTRTPARKGVVSVDPNSTFFKQPARINSSGHTSGECACDDKRLETISYRSIDFKAKELVDMRQLIHQKIEQTFQSSPLWNSIMPVKIFTDLVSFFGDPTGELKRQFD